MNDAHMPITPPKLPAHLLREIAVAADTDPRTVARYVAGEKIKPLCAKRIERALRARGLQVLAEVG